LFFVCQGSALRGWHLQFDLFGHQAFPASLEIPFLVQGGQPLVKGVCVNDLNLLVAPFADNGRRRVAFFEDRVAAVECGEHCQKPFLIGDTPFLDFATHGPQALLLQCENHHRK